jgi:anti-sigma factor RsiW
MNECTDSDVREMLPDLLHSTLAPDAKGRVEAHLATCEECREDLEVLRTVKEAAIFAPAIDVDHVVRQIPPYRTIVPATERPASTRIVSWLVAASLAVVVIGGGSLVVMRQNTPDVPFEIASNPAPVVPESTQSIRVVPSVSRPGTTGTSVVNEPARPHALALAANVDDLSDGSLAQLMDEMSDFDALPASEPDPVISVDSGL